jgi:hypothetical protein
MLKVFGFYASNSVFLIALGAGVLMHKPWAQILIVSVAAYFIVGFVFKAVAGVKK